MNAKVEVSLRPATPEDAIALAKLIDIAGEGIPSWLWSQSASADHSPLQIGTERAARETGGFSFKNATVACVQDDVAGMLLGYPIDQAPDDNPDKLPLPIAPFVALEKQSVGTWYVNALAVFPQHRGLGIGSQLLRQAEVKTRLSDLRTLSIQVYAQNVGAVRLYQRHGYSAVSSERVREHPCQPYYSGDVTLLFKPIDRD